MCSFWLKIYFVYKWRWERIIEIIRKKYIYRYTTLRPKGNSRRFTNHIFRLIFPNTNHFILIQMSLKFSFTLLVHAWCRLLGDKPLSEPMLAKFTDACMSKMEGVLLHFASCPNKFLWYPIFADGNSVLILWQHLCWKLDDGSASKMRCRHIISNTNHFIYGTLWTPHYPRINDFTKAHLESSSVVKHPPGLEFE